ncbi:MAG: hypothetical protein HC936_08170 [Leptolyngbyaceae cyanobacterium SU_3_3]|nr:hypothetical protein [Leptolyngbyaceae cyanobacterium SU_3_3]NJR48333.1 hypothetical protein [Leptolyngbyaceae cyanobacterium CSU_1_3]
MDVAILTAFLTPFLPFLTKLGEKAAESAAGKLGTDAWEKAKALWTKLHPKLEEKEAAKEAVDDVVKNPEDADLQTVLRMQLKKLLEKDENAALAKELAQIMNENAPDGTSGTQIIQTVLENSGVVAGQITGGTVIGSIQMKDKGSAS